MQINRVFNVWATAASDHSGGRQITSGELEMIEVAVAPNGDVFARSRDGQLWRMNRDGSGRTRFTDKIVAEPPAFCGGFVLVQAWLDNATELTRVDGEGTNAKTLVRGCVKKTRNRHAVRKMEEGPPEPSCRRRLQTAVSCFSQKLRW